MQYEYKCPDCGSTDLEVTVTYWATTLIQVTCWATLIQSPDGVETDITTSEDGSHEWDGASLMRCTECWYCGDAKRFDSSTTIECASDGGQLK